MLESEAIVVSIKNGVTFVEAQSAGGCGKSSCATQGCGTAVLTQLFSQQPKALEVNNPIAAGIGERVIVGLQEQVFLKTAIAVYLLPLSALLIGAAVGLFMAGNSDMRDLYAGLGALFGLISSLFLLKHISLIYLPHTVQASILRRL